MTENAVYAKSFEFAVRIVNLYKYLTGEKREYIMAKQIMRSGTSIGANVAEAQRGQSHADFLAKMSIALKEANETEYWLRLLRRTEYINDEQFSSLWKDNDELISLLIAICKTSNRNK